MAKDYYADLIAILLQHGCWQIAGGKGSHEKWCSPVNGRTFTVPRSRSRHTANGVLKQAGLKKAF
ncbi:MAG: type II toxin-antitoxin system HicA family toxin [Pseudomonadota bacterium]|nr:type II toxin-antitoxin system HicA family toxin [Pseudomonadota bacterium]